MMKYLWIFLLTLTHFTLFSQEATITGTVFEDKNGNDLYDAGETGVAQVVVSDQVNTTMTMGILF